MLKQFSMMQKMIKGFGKMGKRGMQGMPSFPGMPTGFPTDSSSGVPTSSQFWRVRLFFSPSVRGPRRLRTSELTRWLRSLSSIGAGAHW